MLDYLKQIIESDEVKSFKIHMISGEEHPISKTLFQISFSKDEKFIICKGNAQTRMINVKHIESIITP